MAAQSPYLISVRDIMHKPGAMREYKLDIVTTGDFGDGLVKVSEGIELDLDLRVESVHEGILATGEVFVDADGECSRCLDPITVPVEVDFQELFAYSLTNEDDYVVEDEQIDLEQVIRDAVVLSLPFHPVCRKNCLGLCPDCGVKVAENPHHVHDAAIDTRWSALESFTKKEE
ncbi:MAG: hypothetical protein RLZZ258_1023 [Actinomycetota bacterium]|jgi:uncharacterized protein|uniref:YceD family protein n=1 Tax=Rhodoluna sp. TaxID=1969481 RepID=UPI0025D12A71|nr:YceD family protein [Rhodoluna sp.]